MHLRAHPDEIEEQPRHGRSENGDDAGQKDRVRVHDAQGVAPGLRRRETALGSLYRYRRRSCGDGRFVLRDFGLLVLRLPPSTEPFYRLCGRRQVYVENCRCPISPELIEGASDACLFPAPVEGSHHRGAARAVDDYGNHDHEAHQRPEGFAAGELRLVQGVR